MAERRPKGGMTTAATVAIWLARLVRPRTVPTLTVLSTACSISVCVRFGARDDEPSKKVAVIGEDAPGLDPTRARRRD